MKMFWEKLVIFLLAAIFSRGHGYEPQPPRIVEEPMDTVVVRHQPATLECRAEGEPPPAVRWYKDGAPLAAGGAGGARRVLLPAGGLFFLRATHARRDTDQGIYWCEASNRLGTVRSRNASLQVAVLREDFRLEPADTRGAAGDSALLECAPPRGTPEPNVFWRKNGQIMDLEDSDRIRIVDGGNLIIQDLRQSDDGRYQCVAKNVVGSRESAIAYLRVHVKPYLIAGPSDAIALVGGSVTFQCRVGGDPLPDVLWRREAGGGNMPLGRVHILEDRSLKLEGVELEDQGEYSCEADNSFGSVSASGMLKVHSPPFFDIKPVAQSIEVGSDAFYECLAKGNPRPTLFWSLEGNHSLIFPGVTWDRYRASMSMEGKSTLVLETAQKQDSGATVVCSAINTAGAITSRAKLLVISEDERPPPVIKIGPSNQTLPIKSIAEFPCSAIGVPDPMISWYHNSVPLLPSYKVNISDTGTLTIKPLEKEDSGFYNCVASNKNGKYVLSAILKVDSPTNPSVNFFRAPNPSTLPGAPNRPQIRNQSENSVTLTWSSNSKTGSSSILGYQVEMFERNNFGQGKNESKWTVVTRRLLETSHTQKMMNAGASYIFFVRAENAHGFSSPSAFSETVVCGGDSELLMGVDEGVSSALIAEARANLQADEVVRLKDVISVDSTVVKLAWETLNSYNLEGFYIYYRPLDGQNITIGDYSMQTVLHSGSVSGFAISGLRIFTTYEFFLIPFYKNIDGRPSNSKVARTLEDAPSEPPTNLEAFLLNSTSVYLKWKPPPETSHKGMIQYYQVIVRESGNSSRVIHNVSVAGSNTRISGLRPGSTYWLQMAAATSRGTGPYSPAAALRLPYAPSLGFDPSSKLLDHHLNRNALERNPQQIDASDLLTETWFLALIISTIILTFIIIIGMYIVRRKILLAKKNGLPNLYDSRAVGTNLITHLNIKGTAGIPSAMTTSYNPSHITKTDSLMWMDNRTTSWRQSSKVVNGMMDYNMANASRMLPEYDKINAQSMPDYAEVDAAMESYRKVSMDDTKSTGMAAYASVPVIGNEKQNIGSLGWMQMCAGSKNIVNEDPEEEVYPASNGGYYNRNVYSDTYFSGDHANMFKFDSIPSKEERKKSPSKGNSSIDTTSGHQKTPKERTYSLPQTPCGTIRKSHRLQVIKSQNMDKIKMSNENQKETTNNTYHEIRTHENPSFSLFDDQNCRLSDMPDDDKEYFGHVQPMKLISHQYSRPSITRPSPTGKGSGLTSFSTLKTPNQIKSEYHPSTRSEPGNQ